MKLRRRMAAVAAGIALAPVLLVLMPASPASAHGWITDPPSRQAMCAAGRVTGCNGLEFEPQSVEATKGAHSCSGGSRFGVLDDDSKDWPVTNVGSTVTFKWKLTVAHRTSTWDYYVDGKLFTQVDEHLGIPSSLDQAHTISGLPSGRHKILAIWNIADTVNAFYNCVDVMISGAGSPPPPPPPPPPSGCQAWNVAAIYTGGMAVTHNGAFWQAKWWTQGEEPGTTGQWGVWAPVTSC